MTLSITSFNSTTGRVNVSLSNGNMELLLSGMFPGSLQQSVYQARCVRVTQPGGVSGRARAACCKLVTSCCIDPLVTVLPVYFTVQSINIWA